jgi:hypothetical protein
LTLVLGLDLVEVVIAGDCLPEQRGQEQQTEDDRQRVVTDKPRDRQ